MIRKFFKGLRECFVQENQVEEVVTVVEQEPVISSPVIEFIEVYRKNHRRFKVNIKAHFHSESSIVNVTDRLTGEQFGIYVHLKETGRGYRYPSKNLSLITDDELRYIHAEMLKVHGERSTKLREIKESRVARQNRLARERLTKVYSQE